MSRKILSDVRSVNFYSNHQGINIVSMSGGDEPQLGPGAAYSAQVAAWLQQAYQAQLMQYGNN